MNEKDARDDRACAGNDMTLTPERKPLVADQATRHVAYPRAAVCSGMLDGVRKVSMVYEVLAASHINRQQKAQQYEEDRVARPISCPHSEAGQYGVREPAKTPLDDARATKRKSLWKGVKKDNCPRRRKGE
jgi:hypothetical protein